MLSEALIQNSHRLEQLESEDFQKVINYTINLLLNKDNKMKLNEFIQIEEEHGDLLTEVTLGLITALSRFRTSGKELSQDIALLMLTPHKADYFKQKIEEHLYELRKVIYGRREEEKGSKKALNEETINLNWKFQAEIASKNRKNCFKPNVQLMLTVPAANIAQEITGRGHDGSQQAHNGDQQTCTFNVNFSNLKELHRSLEEALKMHNSSKTKMARLNSV